MEKILEIGVLLSSERDLDRLLERILQSVMDLAHCDAGTLYLLRDGKLHFRILRNHTLPLGDDPSKLPPVPLDRKNVCALALLEDRTIRVADVRRCADYDFSGPIRYDAMTGYHTESMLVVPMRSRTGEKLGVLQLINAMDERGAVCPFSDSMAAVLESVASQAAITIQNVRYLREIQELLHSFVRAMSAAIDRRSPYNGNHTRHMAACGERFLDYLNAQAAARGEAIPFPPARREALLMSVWLHDVGKLVIPLEVMDKPTRLLPEQHRDFLHRMEIIRLRAEIDCLSGRISPAQRDRLAEDTRSAEAQVDAMNTGRPLSEAEKAALASLAARTYDDGSGHALPWLTEEEIAMLSIPAGTLSDRERQIIQSHAQATDQLLSEIRFPPDLAQVRPWAAGHHELLNGRGYPRHLSGDQIPTEVRILTILDIYDALTAADRPYKRAKPPEVAAAILRENAQRGELDPDLVEQFLESRCWENIQ